MSASEDNTPSLQSLAEFRDFVETQENITPELRQFILKYTAPSHIIPSTKSLEDFAQYWIIDGVGTTPKDARASLEYYEEKPRHRQFFIRSRSYLRPTYEKKTRIFQVSLPRKEGDLLTRFRMPLQDRRSFKSVVLYLNVFNDLHEPKHRLPIARYEPGVHWKHVNDWISLSSEMIHLGLPLKSFKLWSFDLEFQFRQEPSDQLIQRFRVEIEQLYASTDNQNSLRKLELREPFSLTGGTTLIQKDSSHKKWICSSEDLEETCPIYFK